MKIGFVVSFFDFRNDVRRLIAIAAKSHDVVVLVKRKDSELIQKHLLDSIDYRIVNERKRTLFNFMWERIYFLFRSIPKSRNNFLLMEFFKLSQTTSVFQKKKNYLLIKLLSWLPKFISYDYYLSKLRTIGNTKLDDIEQFVFFTAIADDYLLSRLLKENYPVKVYIYSWDHPYKHTCFSQKVNYLVGNDQTRGNLADLQNLPLDRIQVVGSSQFGYLFEFQKRPILSTSSYSQPYFYFGCAIGIPELAIKEAELVEIIAKILSKERSEMLLIVRPYPFFRDLQIYDDLKNLANVIFDDQYRSTDLAISEWHIVEKLNKLKHANAFFHLGTTMGLEACLLDVPSFLIALEPPPSKPLSLYNFAHQSQNEEYLIQQSPFNTLTSMDEIHRILMASNLDKYKVLNQKIRPLFPLTSFDEITHSILDLPTKI